jgi:multicomponent K+:H+ antiporter subunit E
MTIVLRAVPFVLVYAVLTGAGSVGNWPIGGLLGCLVVVATSDRRSRIAPGRLARLLWLPWLLWGAIVDAVRGSMQMLFVVLGRETWHNVGFITCSEVTRTERGLAVLALVQSATPGSVVADIDRETRSLVVNVLDASDPERAGRLIARFYDRYQRRAVP